jgi:hypothetical protein
MLIENGDVEMGETEIQTSVKSDQDKAVAIE